MFGLSRQVQFALGFILLLLVFAGGVLYGKGQDAPQKDVFILEREAMMEKGESTQQLEEYKVHVAGAVMRPGVYKFQANDRVEDVLALAEPLFEADLDNINLASYLRDEQRIYVPYRVTEEEGSSQPTVGRPKAEGKVNINTATKEELMTLPGIGPTIAQRIIDYRESSGHFGKTEDLKKVSGIGEKKYQELEALITN